jgi:DNA invertase Pin-like site-specific DNA recombinase
VSSALALLVALGALLAALAAMALRSGGGRRGPTAPVATTPAIASMAGTLYLEGTSADAAVGDFGGRALATAIVPGRGNDPRAGDTLYLIDDPRKAAPIWVSARDVRRAPARLAAGEPVIGYVTLAADAPSEHADDPARAVGEMAERSGWELVDVVTDRETGRALARPGLTHALGQIAEGNARGLLVDDLRPLSRSIADLGALVEWFRDADAALVCLDVGIDTSTPAGQEVATMLATLGEWERERVARRARSGLAKVRAPGGDTPLPAIADRSGLAERIIALRRAGMTPQAIADQLNAEGVPTFRGSANWQPTSVQVAAAYRKPAARDPSLPPLEEDRQQ